MALGLHIAGFLRGSAVQGAKLIHRAQQAEAASQPCLDIPGGQAARGHVQVRGELEVPSLGLTAPVEDGVSDAVLSDAVGHVHASVWPGQPGTSVLPAHDVTWFSRLGQLSTGAKIRYDNGCLTYTFRVTAHRVASANTRVYNTATPSMLLVTCYPLNALYPTSSRYLVFATLARVQSTTAATHRPASSQPLTVPAPRALAAQGLTLNQNEAPLGVLRIAGAPSWTWRQSNGPWQAESTALATYFGAIHSASQKQRAWWKDLAPNVPASAAAALWGGHITAYDSHLNIALDAVRDRLVGATLRTVITTTGPRPGTYLLKVSETVRTGKVLITGFEMRPSGF